MPIVATEQRPKRKTEGHFYWPDGKPCFRVKKADGELRATNIADAKKMGLFSSITTICGIVKKANLSHWQESILIKVCHSYPAEFTEPLDLYEDKVRTLYSDEMSVAPDRGTAIHKAIEEDILEWIKNGYK